MIGLLFREALDRLHVHLNMYLVCNTNISTLCAGCPEAVTVIMPVGPPYTAGDVLTCNSDGYPATYAWEVDDNPASSTYTYVLEEGVHEYKCTATVTFDDGTDCEASATVTVTAHSKY